MVGEAADDRWKGNRLHHFTVAEYRRMADAGILREESRVELIRGQVIDKVPVSPTHAGMVNLLVAMLTRPLERRGILSVRNPVQLDDFSEPEPDIAILKFRTDFYRAAVPCAGDVLLAIEVADTTLQEDRDAKMPLYAYSGIPECWLVNAVNNVVEVYRKPVEGRYSRCHSVSPGDSLDVAALPGLALMSDDLWIV